MAENAFTRICKIAEKTLGRAGKPFVQNAFKKAGVSPDTTNRDELYKIFNILEESSRKMLLGPARAREMTNSVKQVIEEITASTETSAVEEAVVEVHAEEPTAEISAEEEVPVAEEPVTEEVPAEEEVPVAEEPVAEEVPVTEAPTVKAFVPVSITEKVIVIEKGGDEIMTTADVYTEALKILSYTFETRARAILANAYDKMGVIYNDASKDELYSVVEALQEELTTIYGQALAKKVTERIKSLVAGSE